MINKTIQITLHKYFKLNLRKRAINKFTSVKVK